MPRWIAVHMEGRLGSVDAEVVAKIRPVDPHAPTQHGTLLSLCDGTEVHVDEAVIVMRALLEGPA